MRLGQKTSRVAGVVSAASSCRAAFLTEKHVHGIISCFRISLLQVYAARVAMGLRLAKKIARQVPVGEVKVTVLLFLLCLFGVMLVSCAVPCAMRSGGQKTTFQSVLLFNDAGRLNGVT